MSNSLFKIIATFFALIIYSVFLFQKCDFKQESRQLDAIDQLDKKESKEDSLNTARATVLLCQKDRVIQMLKSKLEKDKANSKTQKAKANTQHILNDTLQSRFEREKNLSTCEDLVQGLKFEIVKKDSIIKNLDSEIDSYLCEVKELEYKVDIQEGIIRSKQNLIASKDSTITYYKTQRKKPDFWNHVKIKAAGVIILIETIGWILK